MGEHLAYCCWLMTWIVAAHCIEFSPDIKQDELKKTRFSTKFIEQKVDHFSFTNNATYKMRYLIAEQFWKPGKGPIFFYTGNEGDIVWFSQNTGFMWDIAPKFNAMLVFAEHRYYGKSLPFGENCCKTPEKLGYLTSEQALADYVELVTHLRLTISGARTAPVVVFGGSYGGMLAAWFRIKYPHIVQGAIAASAPILQFSGLTPCGAFNQVVTRDFQQSDPRCPDVIRSSWKRIRQLGKTSDGRRQLQTTLKLCDPVNDVNDVFDWLSGMWTSLAMVDYPYEANFLMPLPAWPVKAACSRLLTQSDPVEAVAQAATLYFNYTGEALTCFNISKGASDKLGADLWDFQACTEMVMPMCSDGKQDMFEPAKWSMAGYVAHCQAQWKVTPRPYWTQMEYGGRKALETASNIVFSNGLLDPWSSGGVLNSTSASVVSLLIPEGAHHLDLRAAHPNDPPSVRSVREKEEQFIAQWISNQL